MNASFKAVKWSIHKRTGDLARPVASEIKEDYSIAVFDQRQRVTIGIRDIERCNKFIGLIFFITGRNGLRSIGGLTANTLRQTIIRLLNPLPAFVPVHRIKPPHH